MPVLVLAQHDDGRLSPGTLCAIAAARQLDPEVHVLVAGPGSVADEVAKAEGVAAVLHADADTYKEPLAEDVAALVVANFDGYDAVLAASTTFGKNVMPRAAALLDIAQVSDVVGIEAPDTFRRPIYAGNVIATVKTSDAKKVITVRTTAFEAVAGTGGSAEVRVVPAAEPAGLSRFVGREVQGNERPDLNAARVVVSGGRGMQSGDNFGLIEELADLMGGAVGASRAAVDAGFVPNEYQVGQTGKIIAPELYVAVGISGAIQHLAGMKDSKVIVAINKDEEAPIFQVADYGLVGDLFTVVPELTETIRKAKS